MRRRAQLPLLAAFALSIPCSAAFSLSTHRPAFAAGVPALQHRGRLHLSPPPRRCTPLLRRRVGWAGLRMNAREDEDVSGIGGGPRIAWLEAILRKAAALPGRAIPGLRSSSYSSVGFGCQEEAFWGEGSEKEETSEQSDGESPGRCVRSTRRKRRVGSGRGGEEFGLAMAQGKRDYMEDIAVAVHHVKMQVPRSCRREGTLAAQGREDPVQGEVVDVSFFSVIDGHGGIEAAQWAERYIFQNVRAELAAGVDPYEALRVAYLVTDAGFLAEAARCNYSSGCAIVSLLRIGNQVYVAGAGDSRAVMFSETGGDPLPLCDIHRPHLASELSRISQLGGWVSSSRISGVLAVSRGMGDMAYKKWVTAEPDVQLVSPREGDCLVVLATDGVWDYLSDDEVGGMVRNAVSPQVAAEQVAMGALDAESEDNVTVLVLHLCKMIENRGQEEGGQLSAPTASSPASSPGGGGGGDSREGDRDKDGRALSTSAA